MSRPRSTIPADRAKNFRPRLYSVSRHFSSRPFLRSPRFAIFFHRAQVRKNEITARNDLEENVVGSDEVIFARGKTNSRIFNYPRARYSESINGFERLVNKCWKKSSPHDMRKNLMEVSGILISEGERERGGGRERE